MTTYDTISFLSDFGRADEFVGVVHSVIRSLAPAVTVIDVTHEIPPHDIRAGGLALARSANYLVPGVVLAVVDPGVGTERRRVAVEVGEGASVLVGPDNGLLAPAVALVGGAGRAVELTDPRFQLEAPGATFDGRDVFGPAAAHLCNGVGLEELGPAVDPASLVPGTLPVSRLDGDTLTAQILWIDRFGNAQLNVDPDDLPDIWDRVRVRAGELTRSARRVGTYGEIGPGEVGLLVDSHGLLSLAVDQGSAADELGLHSGAEIALELAAFDESAPPPGGSGPVEVQIGRQGDMAAGGGA